MRRYTKFTGALALLAIGLLAGRATADIAGSKHDFADTTQYPNNWSNGQICLPCHTPHNATPVTTTGGVLVGPLWNHTMPAGGNSYTMYISASIPDPVLGGTNTLKVEKATAAQQVDQKSLLCLSCHDGTVALDSFGGTSATFGTGGTSVGVLTGNAAFGTDLTKQHPLGAAAKWPVPEASYLVSKTIRDAARVMPLQFMADGSLAVGCTSCHEPHNRAGLPNMLWWSNSIVDTGTKDTSGNEVFIGNKTVDGRTVSGSALCLSCHKK